MFDTLADRIKADEQSTVNRTERILRFAAVVAISIVLFGGLYFGMKMLE